MRGLAAFFGSTKRNDPIKLVDPRPVAVYKDELHTGDAGLDGYSRVAIADPQRAGDMPNITGTTGRAYQGPDESFEQ